MLKHLTGNKGDASVVGPDGKLRTTVMPMEKAYCSYKSCKDTTIYPYAFAGDKCPKCGRPLSWSGTEKAKVELDERDEYGRKRFRMERRNRKPLGKVTKK